MGQGLLIHKVSRPNTQRLTTVGRTSMDEWSACRRDLYLTTHNTPNKHLCPDGIRTNNLNRRANADLHLRSLGYWDLVRGLKIHIYIYIYSLIKCSSSVCVANACGLDGPGVESGWRRHFPHLSRPVLQPTKPPVQWVPVLSRRIFVTVAWRWTFILF